MGFAVIALAACQSLETARLKKIQDIPATKSNALIYCSGTENCVFERLDNIQIVKEGTKRIDSQAIEQKIVRLNGKSVGDKNALFLSVPAKQHEVVIRFYPISDERAEKIHVIHNFKPTQHYTFNMYRQRSNGSGSLLNVSPPEPLCVDLKEGKKTIRRFCKPYNVLNGLGEFVEKKI